ncbi:hypothetical protein VBM87_01900 [Mycoplasma sp. 744]|uniref:hypothetical protein n=1 Tax=Mycoplasma sp. 744 TaxID=3108531 RepID=UPI002B1E5675|nr:hypothetical protein [Mycoplasma sp. 744]MEA4115532.1 hypothetical protein [Mycoplasma sp. 744]
MNKIINLNTNCFNDKELLNKYLKWVTNNLNKFVNKEELFFQNNDKYSEKIQNNIDQIFSLWNQENIRKIVIIANSSIIKNITFLQDALELINKKNNRKLIFVDENTNTDNLIYYLSLVDKNKFAIYYINYKTNDIVLDILFREFRKLLESQWGIQNSRKFICFIGNKNNNIFNELINNNYQTILFSNDLNEKYLTSNYIILSLFNSSFDKKLFFKGLNKVNYEFFSKKIDNDICLYFLAIKKINSQYYQFENIRSSQNLTNFEKWYKQLFSNIENNGFFIHNYLIYKESDYDYLNYLQDNKKISFSFWNFKNNQSLNKYEWIEKQNSLNKYVNNCLPFKINVNNLLKEQKRTIQENLNFEINIENEMDLGYFVRFMEYLTFIYEFIQKQNNSNTAILNELFKNNIIKEIK